MEGYYECMLAQEGNGEDIRNIDAFASDVTNDETKACNGVASEKWKGQIEKVNFCVNLKPKHDYYYYFYVAKACLTKIMTIVET